MDTPSTSIRVLAGRLLALEAAGRTVADDHESFRVCEKLRISLTRFAGAYAFSALMRRSLALSRAEIPALENVILGADGCVEGVDLIAADGGIESGTAITAHLLWLLITFMGEPIALRLVRDAWPEVPLD